MDFEDFLLSFIEQVQPGDIEKIVPLLILNDLICADDLLDMPNDWLQENCDVIAEGETFQILQEKNGKHRMFVDDWDNPPEPYALQVKCHIVAKEEIPVDEYGDFEVDPQKHGADYCAELSNSAHLNMDGQTVITYAWFVTD